jgi:hypothetical protein
VGSPKKLPFAIARTFSAGNCPSQLAVYAKAGMQAWRKAFHFAAISSGEPKPSIAGRQGLSKLIMCR